MNFRSIYRFLVPSWLNDDGEGTLVLHTLSMMLDSGMQRMLEGTNARFPTRACESALAYLGSDRGIQRGRNESSEHYANRLVAWRGLNGHRTRGSAFALLNQVSEYFGGLRSWAIDASRTKYFRDIDGSQTITRSAPWVWDSLPASDWARFWVVADCEGVFSEQPDFGDATLWGGAVGTEGYTVGLAGATEDDAIALRELMTGRAWRPAGTQPEWLILLLENGWGFPTPNATWEHWSQCVAGEQVETRGPHYRYISLSPAHNNVYQGLPASFATTIHYVDFGVTGLSFSGVPSLFPLTIPMPDGSSYVGDPTVFPATIQLIDDGDLPI